MPKFPTKLSTKLPIAAIFVVFTFLVTLGLAVSLQVVLGINIGSVLDLQNNKITNVGPPTSAGDAATWDFVNSVASTKQNTVTGSCPMGQGIRVVNPNGSVTCETIPPGLQSTDVVAGQVVHLMFSLVACPQPSDGGSRCDAFSLYSFQYYTTPVDYDPRGVLTANISDVATPCYNTPNGSWNPCGSKQTHKQLTSFSCSGGFVADPGHALMTVWNSASTYECTTIGTGGCSAAVCRLP